MPRLHRINVVYIYVADLEKTRRFYQSVLGFGDPVIETENWVEFALETGSHFALHLTHPEALAGYEPQRNTVRFSIVVDQLDPFFQQLTQEAGVPFTRSPEQGAGFRLAEILDPEGNPIRLIEYAKNPSCH